MKFINDRRRRDAAKKAAAQKEFDDEGRSRGLINSVTHGEIIEKWIDNRGREFRVYEDGKIEQKIGKMWL